MPRRVKRKRPILLEDGTEAGGMEEYYDYIFPVSRLWSLGGHRLAGSAAVI